MSRGACGLKPWSLTLSTPSSSLKLPWAAEDADVGQLGREQPEGSAPDEAVYDGRGEDSQDDEATLDEEEVGVAVLLSVQGSGLRDRQDGMRCCTARRWGPAAVQASGFRVQGSDEAGTTGHPGRGGGGALLLNHLMVFA